MTAVDWLLENLPLRYKNAMLNTCQEEINKAKAMEKEQIITAFEDGYESCDLDEAFEINRKLASGELYYNKTYNQNK